MRFYLSDTHQNRKANYKNNQGFSIIEIIVSLSLFGIGLLSIIQLQIQAQALVSDSVYKNQALVFASSRHEIHQLGVLEHEGAATLTAKWIKDVQILLPQVRVETTNLSISNFQINLTWAASSENTGCIFSQIKGAACLRL